VAAVGGLAAAAAVWLDRPAAAEWLDPAAAWPGPGAAGEE
jgi:hypothetical protein